MIRRIMMRRFRLTDASLEQMVWPEIPETRFIASTQEKFSSRLRWMVGLHTNHRARFQIRHEDFRQRIAVDDEDINSILNWYKLADAVFLDHLSQVRPEGNIILCLRTSRGPTAVLCGGTS